MNAAYYVLDLSPGPLSLSLPKREKTAKKLKGEKTWGRGMAWSQANYYLANRLLFTLVQACNSA